MDGLKRCLYLFILIRLLKRYPVVDDDGKIRPGQKPYFLVFSPGYFNESFVKGLSDNSSYIEFSKIISPKFDIRAQHHAKVSLRLLSDLLVREPGTFTFDPKTSFPTVVIRYLTGYYIFAGFWRYVERSLFDMRVAELRERYRIIEVLWEIYAEANYVAYSGSIMEAIYGDVYRRSERHYELMTRMRSLVLSLQADGLVEVKDDHVTIYAVQATPKGIAAYFEWLDGVASNRRQRRHDRMILISTIAAAIAAGASALDAWIN